jgi:hypothetical protein
MKYCEIYHTHGEPYYPTAQIYDEFAITIYNVSCDTCKKFVTDAIEYNGAYLNVIRHHYYDHHYDMNNETGNELVNSCYPDYPHSIQLCEECIKNIIISDHISFDDKDKDKNNKCKKLIGCPINNKEYYCDENDIEKYEELFENCYDNDFISYRYEYCD